MSFLSVLFDIKRNKGNFQKWEKAENDNEAKRQKLYEQKPLSPEELKQKQKLADTIIDTITIMDEHSEDVSEDVETITQSVSSISMLTGLLCGGFLSFKLISPKIKKIQNELIALREKITPEQLKQISKTNPHICSARSILEPFGKEKKIIIPNELKQFIEPLKEQANKLLKKQKKLGIFFVASTIFASTATYLATVLGATKLQVGSSRIARYQAREKLDDPKNFVIYTDEQIAQAKENLKNKKPEKTSLLSKFKNNDKNGLIDSFKNIKNLFKDKKKYDEWKKENAKRDPRIKRELTPEELKEAKADKEVIQRITKKINNRAEEYSENMETAATVILGSSLLGGPILGGSVSWVLNKLGLGSKIAKGIVGKLGNKEAAELCQQLEKATPNTPEFKALKAKFQSVLADAIEQKGGRSELLQTVKKWIAKGMTTKFGRNKVMAIATGAVTSVVGIILALKLQKSAARAGRYNAKEELRKNPQEFIYYSEEEMNQVKDVTAEEKSLSQKFKEYMTFLPRAFKHHREYMNYKKGELKQDKALREELVKLEVTDEQLREGKNLQRKLFNTFEKIDDKSQEYSENMEAATEIATQATITAGYFATVAPFIALFGAIAAGKGTAVATTVLNGISKVSFIAKSKFFKKYLGEVAQNIEKKVHQIPDYMTKYSSSNENKIGLNFIIDMIKNANSENKTEITKFVNKIIKTNLPMLQTISTNTSKAIADTLKETDTKTLNSLLDKIATGLDAKELTVKLLTNDKKGLQELLSKNACSKAEEDLVLKLLDKITKHTNNASLAEGLKLIPEESLSFIDKLTSKIKITPQDTNAAEAALKALNKNKKTWIKGLNSFERIVKNIPAEEISQAIEKVINVAVDNPEKFSKFIQDTDALKTIFMTPNLKKVLTAAGISWGVFTTGVMFAVQSYFAKLQKEAGKLGVMKAMEELQDERIYADKYPKEPTNIQTIKNTNLPPNIQALLNKKN